MKMFKCLAAAAAAALIPAAAAAADFDGLYAGVQGGYHDLDFGLDGAIFGGYVGFNAPMGGNLVVGVEANANLGTSDIDAEYGASVHIGGRFGDNGLLFARAGYQEVDFDLPDAIDELDDVDTTDGDYLLGVGAEFGAGQNGAFRVAVDTIAFDSLRATAGYTFHF